MNLSANHCKLLQRVWRELRHDKLRQIERPVLWSSLNPDHSPLSTSSSLGVVCVWNDPMQQDLAENRSPWTTKTPNDETPSRMGREPPVWEPRHHSTVPTQPSPAALSAQSTGPSTAPPPFVPRNAETYRAIYSYYELALQEDDIVLVVERCDDGWFIGTLLRTGEFGTFPANYVVKH